MSRKLRIPPPPLVYSAEYESVRNREIEQIVNGKIGATDASIFGGVPFTALRGSDAAFSIPVGTTPVKLPFNTLVKDTDPLVAFDAANYAITNPFACDLFIVVNIRHAAAPGGTYDFNLQAFNNNVGLRILTIPINNNQTQDIRASRFVVDFPAGTYLDLRAWHSRTGPVSFDMSLSTWDVLRMSATPRVL